MSDPTVGYVGGMIAVPAEGAAAAPAVPTISADRRSIVSVLARLRTPRGQADPYPLYAELRSLGDVVPAPWGGHLVTSYELGNEVLRSRAWSVPDAEWRGRRSGDVRWDRPAVHSLSRTLSGLNPPEHTRQRSSLGNLFDRASLQALRTPVRRIVERAVDRLAAELAGGAEADFVPLVGEVVPVATVGHWLGIPAADRDLVRRLTHEHVHAGELLPTPSQLAVSDAASDGLRDYFTGLVQERRRRPSTDLLSGWIRTWDDIEPDRETADEALYHLAMFITMAALETTSTVLSGSVWRLDRTPGVRASLQADPELIPAAVEEILRYDPPIHVISRFTPEDTELGGHRIGRDEVVHVLVGSGNHDPAHFPDADAFDIHRTGPHLAFGGGAHYCLGAALARLELTALIEVLLQRLPGLRVSTPPVYAPRVVFRRLTELKVSGGP